ncbi:hypothetical protein, partial [Actinopolymorpha sp. B9G3]|uniref:hypothetical protein n=1 Tax=Actinopolymorpha sp. B9G3 TaxID=3158970 RepID=UPI0032D9153C
MTGRGNLEDDDQDKLDHALAACPHLSATATHATAFAEMMTGLHGDRLTSIFHVPGGGAGWPCRSPGWWLVLDAGVRGHRRCVRRFSGILV